MHFCVEEVVPRRRLPNKSEAVRRGSRETAHTIKSDQLVLLIGWFTCTSTDIRATGTTS